MNAWITARRIKPGHEEPFRKQWAGDSAPDGMVDAWLLEEEGDPTRTISLSLWDTADHLLRYRTSTDARKRDDDLGEHTVGQGWNRGFVAWRAAELAGGKVKPWMAFAPAALVLLAGSGFLLFKKLRGGSAEKDEFGSTYVVDAEQRTTPARETVTVGQPLPGTSPPSGVRPVVAGNAHAPEPGGTPSAARAGGQQTVARTEGRRPNLLVRDLMTANPATVNHDDDAATAAQKMRDLNVGSLPVLADGKLAGMITDRDITVGLADGTRAPGQVKVHDLMTEVPLTISPHISAQEAAETMASRQIRRLPVVEGTRLVGIIALGDLAADGAPNAAGDALEGISEPARPQR